MRKQIFNYNEPDISCEAIDIDSLNEHEDLRESFESLSSDLVSLISLENIKGIINNTLENNEIFDIRKLSLSEESRNIVSEINFKEKSLFIGIESNTDKNNNTMQTMVALESIVDHIKNISTRVIETIKKIWRKIQEIFNSLFSKKDSIIESLETQLKDVEQLPDNGQVIAKEDSDIGLIHSLIPFGIKGVCDYDTTKTIVKNSDLLIEANVEIVQQINVCLKSINTHKSFDGLNRDVQELVKYVKKFISKLQLVSKRIDGPKEIYTYGYLVGNQICELTEYVNKSHSNEMLKLFNIEVKITSDEVKSYTPKILRKTEMADLGKLAIELVEDSKKIDKLLPDINRVLEDNIEYIKDNDSLDNIGLLTIDLINDLFKYISHNLPKTSSDANKVAVYVGRYIKYCVAQYKQGL